MTNIQAIGILRFSYAGLGGYQVLHDSIEERLEYLFNPSRIEERFMLFEHVALPCIKAQTDPDFTLIVVTSKNIPEVHLERLLNLVDGIPQIALVLKEPQQHRDAMLEIVRPYKDNDADVIAHFILDDDDAFALDFIERMKAGFEQCKTAYNKDEKCALDFSKGYKLSIGDGQCYLEKKTFSLATAAMAIFLPPARRRTILHFPHHRIQKRMPVITDTTADMYVRCFNTFNDSPLARTSTVPEKPTKQEDIDTVMKRFNLSIPDLIKAIQS